MRKKEIDLTVKGLARWLKDQVALRGRDRTYDYCDNKKCLLCQYLKSQGIGRPLVSPTTWRRRPGAIPERLPFLLDVVSRCGDGNFGLALERAERILALGPGAERKVGWHGELRNEQNYDWNGVRNGREQS